MLTRDTAELIGLHVGDGTLYRTGRSIVWELRGGLDEKAFYDNHITELLSRITGDKFKAKRSSGGKNGCYGIQDSNREPVTLLQAYGFRPGTKTYTASVPGAIIEADDEVRSAFLRGLFATDGTFYMARTNGSENPSYPMIEFASASMKLRDETRILLQGLGMEGTIWTYKPKKGSPCYFFRLAGAPKTERFITTIGLANPKHVSRHEEYLHSKQNI